MYFLSDLSNKIQIILDFLSRAYKIRIENNYNTQKLNIEPIVL